MLVLKKSCAVFLLFLAPSLAPEVSRAQGLLIVTKEGIEIPVLKKQATLGAGASPTEPLSAKAKQASGLHIEAKTEAPIVKDANARSTISAETEAELKINAEAETHVTQSRPPEDIKANGAIVSALDAGDTIRFLGVLFDYDKDTLKSDALPAISDLAVALQARPNLEIRIEGHTDNQGSPEYNRDLSMRRALSVTDALVRKGVERSRLFPKGFGYDQPVAANDTAQGRALNRRVDIIPVGKE